MVQRGCFFQPWSHGSSVCIHDFILLKWQFFLFGLFAIHMILNCLCGVFFNGTSSSSSSWLCSLCNKAVLTANGWKWIGTKKFGMLWTERCQLVSSILRKSFKGPTAKAIRSCLLLPFSASDLQISSASRRAKCQGGFKINNDSTDWQLEARTTCW